MSPVFNLYDEDWPIRTHQRQYPPAKFVFAEAGRTGTALDSIVSSWHASSLAARCATRVVSPDVRVNSYSEIDSSILFTHVNVGRHCRIRQAIIDRDVHIPEGTTIGYDPEADRQRYFVTESGITVVTRDYSLFENPGQCGLLHQRVRFDLHRLTRFAGQEPAKKQSGNAGRD